MAHVVAHGSRPLATSTVVTLLRYAGVVQNSPSPCRPPTRPSQAHKAVKQAEGKIRQLREALADESARKEV